RQRPVEPSSPAQQAGSTRGYRNDDLDHEIVRRGGRVTTDERHSYLMNLSMPKTVDQRKQEREAIQRKSLEQGIGQRDSDAMSAHGAPPEVVARLRAAARPERASSALDTYTPQYGGT